MASLVFILLLLISMIAGAEENVSADGCIHIVLKPGISISRQMNSYDTIYEIQNTFDLKGRNLSIPVGCALLFKGGYIRNGTIEGNDTAIIYDGTSTVFANVSLIGTWRAGTGCPEWFGAAGNGKADDREAVQQAFNICDTVILKNTYLIRNAPFDYGKYKPVPENELDYYLDVMAQKNRCTESELTPLKLSSNKTVVLSGTVKSFSPLGNLIEIIGNNTSITGGGTVSGCGIVHTVNVYSGTTNFPVTKWDSALIYIKGSNNRVENIIIKDPAREGISIDDYLSSENRICNNVFGGGLRAHTEDIGTCSFTALFGIYDRGTNTVIRNNVFKKLDGRGLYDALYCNYSTTNVPSVEKRTDVHTIFENNVVEAAFEHGVYSYASNLRIIGNTFHTDYTALQLFNGKQFVDSNTLYCNEHSLGIYVSGEDQIVTNNKLYNVGRYGIRCAGFYNGSCDNDYVANNYIEKLMVPFSDSDPKTTPAITFESTDFDNNKLHLRQVTCKNNTIICKGESVSARTTPITGIIAVYGDAKTTIDRIDIVNNTVMNSNVADNICITLMNAENHGTAIIEGNVCVNDCPLISTTPGEPVLSIKGVGTAIVRNNHLEQQGKTGTAFSLTNVRHAQFSGNTMIADLYSKSVFYTVKESILDFDGSNVVNHMATERLVTIPIRSTSTSATYVPFPLPSDHWDLEIVPIDAAARNSEKNNPLKILKSDAGGVQLYHRTATKSSTLYRITVKYR